MLFKENPSAELFVKKLNHVVLFYKSFSIICLKGGTTCIEPWGKSVNRVLLFISHLISHKVRQ